MLAFEDDAELVPSFASSLRKALCSLPGEWDVLYLNACHKRVGGFVTSGVRKLRIGACTLGFVTTLQFALKILHERAASKHRLHNREMRMTPSRSRQFNDMPFDIMMMGGARDTNTTFIAEPPLVIFPQAQESVIQGNKIMV